MMDYSPFNPVVWGLFLAFVVSVWIVVRLFARRYPGYPGNMPEKLE
ncbi:hypothetical protein LF599_07230 [Pseudodesulfovibrio thermohalotolerans]|nr:hypothetical protein [Pseudodesulfovibrio thermohalotolerans]WFS63948.1 hypothetical protein LF599_07230 [Pseudodesulfovibrio thermohalotolerans]